LTPVSRVEQHHAPAGGEELLGEGRADEPGAAGDERRH
jgi:hypothetical protein